MSLMADKKKKRGTINSLKIIKKGGKFTDVNTGAYTFFQARLPSRQERIFRF